MEEASGLRLFIMVAKFGSFAAAARHNNMSTASVSRQIAALEDRLKVRLFNRGVRAISLTEAGDLLLRRARPLVEELEETLESVALLAASPRGMLRVGTRAVAAEWLIAALPRFLAENPEVEVDLLISSDEDADLITQNVDVDIRYTRPDRTDLIARLLAPTALILVASPVYLTANGTPKTVEDLRRHEAILYQPLTEQPVWELANETGDIATLVPKGRLRVNDGVALCRAALAGLGIGMMPVKEVERELSSGQLLPVLPGCRIVRPTIGGEGIYAVYQRAPYQTGKLRAFLEFLHTVFADPPVR